MWQVKAIFAVAVFGALVGTDFVIGNTARPMDEKLSFAAYLADRIGGAVPATQEQAAALAATLPAAPAGWTRREAGPGDVADMLVPEARAVITGGGGAPGMDVRRVAAVGGPRKGKALQVAAFAYDRGRNRVVVEAIRHPDAVFTDPARMAERMALADWVMDEGGDKIGTLRGMPVWQAPVAPGLGVRMAIANVGSQVQLRVVYPERMAPGTVLALLEGLDVAALNAAVVEPDAAITAALAQQQEAGQGVLPALLASPLAVLDALTGRAPAADVPVEAVAAAAEEKTPPVELDLSEKRGGRKDVTLGVGSCGSRNGGKFCSVGAAATD